ncbi:uncharacterized protein LOC131883420 isoform X2 [Tigriopus californicus]|uniref:uncharacterized protein LOC131883420 isoform X2 n=1 Tax=Tigriopus californicus TaxID=6832 RepID=UPI0027D9D891|nr:uncharacterized protein LOC131883420 isoform X2 [Tigriopus californicus]
MAAKPSLGGNIEEATDSDPQGSQPTGVGGGGPSFTASTNSISKWASAIVARVTASSSSPSKTSNGNNLAFNRSPSPNETPSKRTPLLRSSAIRTRTPSPRGSEASQPPQEDHVVSQHFLGPQSSDSASTSTFSTRVGAISVPLENEAAHEGESSAVTLTVPPPPRAFLGAIPRHKNSVDSEPTSTSSSCTTSSGLEPRRCFCGYYSELTSQPDKKPGRCKFCRSKAKYLNSQRSFDAAKLFGRRREKAEPRRAISEDRRSDGQTTEDTSASTSSATTAHSSFDRPSPSSRPVSFFSTSPFLRRQERLEIDLPSPNLLTVPPVFPDVPRGSSSTRDHGLRTPPAPPITLPHANRIPDFQGMNNFDRPSEYHTHRMAHELPEYLAPPPRAAVLGRAHTDPTSLFADDSSRIFGHPTSPPPTYSDVLKQNRLAPPSYEEALCARVSDMRLRQTPMRSHSEERTLPTRSRRATARPLTRSSRAEEIPDIYWEQAARELDFCTCRRCQARYRQYFEEDPDPSGDAMIPMETQVLMQEVLTDGMAFCNIM